MLDAEGGKRYQDGMHDVVILGSGCAGWTAALYLARANLKPLVLTGAQTGGLLTTTSVVENFPGFPQGIDGTTLMMQMMEQAQKFGAEVEFGVLADEVKLGRPTATFEINLSRSPIIFICSRKANDISG